MSALAIFVLFLLILAGVSVGRELMAVGIAGPLTVGSLLLILLHLAPVTLGVVYLRRTRPEPGGPGA